jgi:holo-[acyl-carrier protein] synthase
VITAVGIDILELERLEKIWNQYRDRFLERHFHQLELDYCLNKQSPLASLAVRFAAKEAFQKCWYETHGWRDVWVVMDGVKPRLDFSAQIAEEMQSRQLTAHLSLSHSRSTAVAVVVLERLA